jgi:hypothetical protein
LKHPNLIFHQINNNTNRFFLSLLGAPQLSSPSSPSEQQEKNSSLSSSDVISKSPVERQQEQIESSSFEHSSTSNKPTLNPSDLSGSFNEPPTQPKLATYPMNKDKRCFRSQWFSQFCWLEYSILNDSVYCYYCRHFNSGTHLKTRVRNIYSVRKSLFKY